MLDCALDLRPDARHGERVHAHHGAREAPGRLSDLVQRDDLPLVVTASGPIVAERGLYRVVYMRARPARTLTRSAGLLRLHPRRDVGVPSRPRWARDASPAQTVRTRAWHI